MPPTLRLFLPVRIVLARRLSLVPHWLPDPDPDLDLDLDLDMPSPPVLDPTFSDDNPFPPLPSIHDDDIRTTIFTHRSFYARPNHVFEDHPDDPSPDNEKFEHLGDTVLGLVVTRLLLDVYPNLRVGPCTKIRALIVGNPTLAAISRLYELPAQLRLHPAQAITLRASTNIQADVFESYVGGLYLDQGLTAVAKWLNVLFKPYTTEAYTRVRKHHGLPPLPSPVPSPLAQGTSVSSISSRSSSTSDTAPSTPASEASKESIGTASKGATPSLPTEESNRRTRLMSTPAHQRSHHLPHASGTPTTTGHLALFNQQVQKARCEVEWVYDDREAEGTITTPIWAVRVEVDGEVFGRGTGSTKKAARNEAAKEGLVRMGIIV